MDANTQVTQVGQPYTLTTHGRTITLIRPADRTVDLYNRACSLGYTQESAAKLADCWVNFDMVPDACPIHPNHSMSINDGYEVDGCEACLVLILTHDAGYTESGWEATQAKRAADLVAEDFAAERDDMTGVDMLRELLTLEPTRTVKPAVWHLNDGAVRPPCGSAGRQTTEDPSKVTCKRCPGTRRFATFAERTAREAAQAVWSRAGLYLGMVVRHLATGRMGRINELSHSIRVGYWTGEPRSVYSRLTDFDTSCEIVIMGDLVPVGTRLVNNLGGEAVVLSVTADEVRYQTPNRPVVKVTPSELAAEIFRGWLAIIPTTKCRFCNAVLSNTQNHKHFDRPLTWPGMPVRPKALYVRPGGERQAVTTDDVAEVGMRVNYGYGFADNGLVTEVTWHAITIRRDKDGSVYTLSLVEFLKIDASTFMPDANGRPVGSWR